MEKLEKVNTGPIPAWQIPSWQMPVNAAANHLEPVAVAGPEPKTAAPSGRNNLPVTTKALPKVNAQRPNAVVSEPVAASVSAPAAASASASHQADRDEEPELRDPTRFGIGMSAINVFLYSIMSLAQWMGWGGFYAATSTPGRLLTDAFAVMAVNFVFGLLIIVGVFALKPMHFKPWVRYLLIALVSLVAAAPRVLAMLAIYTTPTGPTFLLAEWMSGFVAGTIAVGAGVMTASLVGRARREHARWMSEHEKAQQASDELHTEEMRVRRMVADQLHGRLQFRLVTIAAGLDADAVRLGSAGHNQCAVALSEFANQLDQVREQEVRALSHAVYPAGIELGAVTAIRAMVHRLPPQITASVKTGPTLTRVIDAGLTVMPLAERLIAVFTIEEAITNALKHGHASTLAVDLEIVESGESGQMILVGSVDDDGRGLPNAAASGTNSLPDDGTGHTGLGRHAERLENRGGHLTLANRPTGGTRLEFALPFTSLIPQSNLKQIT